MLSLPRPLLLLLGGAAAAVEAADAMGPPYGHPSPTAKYPVRPGMTLWLVEEFDQPLNLDSDPVWTWSDGGLGEGQVRFVREGIKFRDGRMVIEVNRAPGGATAQSCSSAEKMVVQPKSLTSGELRSRQNWFRYGYYEVRMKAPSVQPGNAKVNGNYVSTMFAYRDGKFRHWREIDIEVTGDTPDSVTMNVLHAENTMAWNAGIQSTKGFHAGGVNVREDFHTYAFDWRPSGITWYFDGEVVGQHRPGDKLPVPDKSAKIMMNLWVFSSLWDFGGPEGANNRYPMHSEYDWFRFYKWDGDAQYPCTGMSAACLSEDDRYLSANNPCGGILQIGLLNGTAPCRAVCGALRESGAASRASNVVYP